MKKMRVLLPALLIFLVSCAPIITPQASTSLTVIPFAPTAELVVATQASPTERNPALQTIEVTSVSQSIPESSDDLWLKILSPEDGDTVNTAVILVKGRAPADTVISVNDRFSVVSADGTFELEITLVAGPNLLEFVASDLNDHEVYVPVTVNFEP